MRFALFYHSLASDWNHGNAHFLRGIASELQTRGHRVEVYEPEEGWSRTNLLKEQGEEALSSFRKTYPALSNTFYDVETLDLVKALEDADVVIVHEWTHPDLIYRIGELRKNGGAFRLFFHDTHHRAATDPTYIESHLDLSHYDGVLAYGEALRQVYLEHGWARRVWTWHEAADTRVFRPQRRAHNKEGDLVWIGNWGDDERTSALERFLLGPTRSLKLQTVVHGVRYPPEARHALEGAGIDYRGWAPNHKVPEIFSRFRTTIHIPRKAYCEVLPGIPTIRVFEALACGIPLVIASWEDAEGLFTPGKDFLVAESEEEMTGHLRMLLHESDLREELATHGRETILQRHTCAHRVDELMAILDELQAGGGMNGRVESTGSVKGQAEKPRAKSHDHTREPPNLE